MSGATHGQHAGLAVARTPRQKPGRTPAASHAVEVPAGSENSDHTNSGNSGHPGVMASGSRLAVESGEGKDAGHAEASRNSGLTASRAQPAGGGKAGRGFRPKRPTGGGRRGGQQHR